MSKHTNPHRIPGTIGLPPCCPTCGETTEAAGPFDTGTTCAACAKAYTTAQSLACPSGRDHSTGPCSACTDG